MVFTVVDELQHIRHNLIQNENRLARLHADIYKRREEARKIRLSMPTPDYLDQVRLTPKVMETLQQKKKKALCSIHQLQDHTQRNIKTYTTTHHGWYVGGVAAIAMVVVVVVSGMYYLKVAAATHGKGPREDRTRACR